MGGGGGCAGPCRCFLVFVQGRSSLMRRGVVTPPYGCNAGGARQRADVGIGPYAPRGDEGRHAGSSCPTGGCGEPPRLPWVAAHSGASAAQTGGTGGNRGRDHPKSVQQRRTIPQSRLRRASFLCTREPLRTGDADRRVASLLAMTVLNLCHSEEAQRADVGIRPFYDGRGFGPPYLGHGLRRPNFVPKFGASVKVIPPYGVQHSWCPATGRRVDGPYGCSAGGALQRRVGRVSGISWTPPPPVRRSGCCRSSRRGP